jgi:hypothetical protein
MMEGFPIYITKVIIIQTTMFAFFWYFNRKNTSHQFNRFYLLATLILPFLIPFIEIPVSFGTQKMIPSPMLETYGLSEHNLTSTGSEQIIVDNENGIAGMPIIAGAYLVIASLIASKLIFSFIQVSRLVKGSHHHERSPRGYVMHYISSSILSFSFLQKIFLSKNFELNPEEKRTVIAHEEFHIAQRHSLDVILAELISMIFWFNPVIHFIGKYLKQIHEYQADAHVCKSQDKHLYAYLLQSHQWKKFIIPLGNSISGSSIKKRIRMMKNVNQRPAIFKVAITAVSTFVLFFAISCQENLESPLAEEEEGFKFEFTDKDLELEIDKILTVFKYAPEEALELYEKSQRANPQYKYYLMVQPILERNKDDLTLDKIRKRWHQLRNVESEIDYLRFLNQEEFDRFYLRRDLNNKSYTISSAYVMVRRVDRLKLAENNFKMSADDKIHDDFDKKARFKGGQQAFSEYLKQNLVYPSEAKANSIEDKVVFRFVVNKLGHLLYLNIDERPTINNEDIKIEFEKAAFSAISNTGGKWLPAEKDGKYVLSRMTVPIEFKLEE